MLCFIVLFYFFNHSIVEISWKDFCGEWIRQECGKFLKTAVNAATRNIIFFVTTEGTSVCWTFSALFQEELMSNFSFHSSCVQLRTDLLEYTANRH